MIKNFFETNSYFIDEKVSFLKFKNRYNVFDDQGQNIGTISQKMSFGDKLLRLIIKKSMLPFSLEIRNNNDQLEVTISRGWTLFLSKITIYDGQEKNIGTIKQKFKLFKPTFKIFNTSEHQIAEINGDWKAWNFKITDPSGNQIGTISKKWGGAMKELFTTADKYNVNIDTNYSNNENKIIILAGAITIDMVLKESN